ncbi:MAG: right-handed parallel beta-helix repeat-containing protein, partial [Treponema sp.]|nr:right-handed parallel beta-helix repeat-containing protein [Treponema sp.]
NGATLTQSGFTAGADSQLLNINATTAEVRISRLHLKGGRALNYGAAIALGAGKLTLESCVFSDNQTSSYGYGGALYIGYNANATVSGCTFYGNVVETTNGNGGAIYSEGTLTLTGNLFWGNAASAYSVVRSAYGSFTTQGYNISDKPSGTGSAQSGWNFVTGDAQALGMPLWAADGFKPFSNGAAYQAIAARPSGYPSVDFNGDAIPLSDAMAGAVQTVIATSGYWLDYAAEGPGQVTVLSGTPNTYGFYTGSVILKASPSAGGSFLRWTVDGQEQLGATDELTIAMDSHKTVRAIFANVRTVDSAANDGPGSLREALTNPAEGVYIRLPAGGVITLTTPLPQITKSLTIEGNGATLTRSFNSGSNTQLLDINSATAEVRISRLHFYQGRSNDNGAAIRNQKGILTLESCIFSDNDTSASMAWGGAIYTGGALSVLGCTFTGNDAATPTNGSGGAIYRGGSGTVFLTGNIFAGNTGQYPVVYFTAAGATTGGYNVSDKPSGTSTGQSGWTFDTTDVPSVTDITFDTTFRPSSATTLSILPSLPSGFPTTYFDGTARGANSTPGAMPKN